MRTHRCLSFRAVLGAFILAAGLSSARAADLPGEDAELLDKLLGDGVVGSAVAARSIDKPASLMPLVPATWKFRLVGGPDAGETEIDALEQSTEAGAPTPWQYVAGQTTIYNLDTTDDGTIVSPSERDVSEGVITTYDPPRLVVSPGMQPGEPRSATLNVNVFNIGDPKKVAHSGSLKLTVTYLGRYQVTVPAGTYAAVLIKWDYEGTVGPANVSDVEYRFFAEGIGPVAVIEKEDISAFLVYNQHTKDGKVLASKAP